MGTDKGLITTNEQTWAQAAASKLGALELPCYLSVNESQHSGYATHFHSSQLIRDNKTIDVRGPLLGVLSAHIELPGEDLFVLACDLPLMEIAVLEQLVESCNAIAADTFFFTNDGNPEPLCAIYTANGLAHVLDLLNTGRLQKHSMKYILEHLPTHTIPLRPDQKPFFRNFNAHADLNGL